MERTSTGFYTRTSAFKKEFVQLLDKYNLKLCGGTTVRHGHASCFVGLKDAANETDVRDYDFIEQDDLEGNYLFTENYGKRRFGE